MNILRTVLVVAVTALVMACSAAPTKPAAPAAPATANIDGNWLMSIETRQGLVAANLTVTQNGKELKGIIENQMGKLDIRGTVDGNEVNFSYSVESFGAPAGTIFDYKGVLEAGVLKGKAKFGNFGEGNWTAKRK